MNLFLFRSEICLKSMLKYVKLNIVVVITLCVGMIIPLVALADIQYFAEYGETARPAVMESVAYFYGTTPRLGTAQLYETLAEDSRLCRIAVSESARRDVEFQGEKYYETVSAVSGELFAFYPPCMAAGRSLEPADFRADAKVCLVEENFYQDKGLSGEPGGKLVIGGEDYSVVGICRKIDSRGLIWIPWSQVSPAQSGSGEIRIIVQYDEGVDFMEVDGLVRSLLDRIISSGTLSQDYRQGRRQSVQLCIEILLLIFPLILISVINCFAVIQGKIRRMRYQFAVEMAYGAKGRDIFQSCLLENLVLCGIALLLDILLLPLIAPYVPAGIEMVWSPRVFFEMFLLMFGVCLFLSRLSARSILKNSPAKILKGE